MHATSKQSTATNIPANPALKFASHFQDRPDSFMEKDQESSFAQAQDSETSVSDGGETNTGAIVDRNNTVDDDNLQGFKRFIVVIALLMSMFSVALDQTIVATAIPRITDEFHNLDQVGWYGSAFFLTLATFQAPWGKCYKNFSLKTTFLTSIFVFQLGSLACGVAKNSTGLIVGRAVQGMGGSGVTGGCFTILAFIVPARVRPQYIGLFGAVYSLASVAGPLLGGVFADKVSWRWCFYVNLPIGAITIMTIFFFFHNPKTAAPPHNTWREILLQLNPSGIVLILGSLTCYMLALEWGGISRSWSSGSVIATLVLWAVLTVAFVFDQRYHGERALLVTRVLTRRNTAALGGFIFFLNAANFLMIYYIPLYFQAISGVSPSESGIRNLPYILSASVVAYLCGHLITRVGYFFPFLITGSVLAVTGSALIYTLGMESTAGQYVGYQIILGVAIGSCIQVPLMTAQAFAKSNDLAITTAIILFFQYGSGALSVSAAQSIFQNQMRRTLQRVIPGLEFARVAEVGATEIRSMFEPLQTEAILESYLSGLKASWGLGIGLAAISAFCSLIPTKGSIKDKEKK